MAADVWTALQAERTRLADELSSLTDDQWRTTSLCSAWTCRDVLAHLVAGTKSTPPKFIVGLISAGFNFDKFIAKELAKEAGQTPAQLLITFRANAANKNKPGPAILGETIVHGEDIRRALGITSGGPSLEHVTMVADAYKKAGPPLKVKSRIAGLTLKATDTAWTTGQGPMVSGTLLDLVMAMAGRPSALASLTGDGVETLRSR